ncbi:hypothetical protein ACQP1V_36240 [Microtetraspora malaysiensis]|uniref:hypothetical protein n=1 Tax=Microtetraspora malaysiensis TaxID=161358 RepID=UPI003D9209F7
MSLRERLQQRARPSAVWPLRIDDPTEAREALERAEHELRVAVIAHTERAPEIAEAEARVAAARAALAACYEPIELVALAPPEFEALAKEHPPTKDDEAWAESFPRALFLACVRSELTRDEWAVVLDSQLSQGEKTEALNMALQANLRVPDAGLPKDWTSILS